MDTVQDVTEISTDIKSCKILCISSTLKRICSPLHCQCRVSFVGHVEDLPWLWDCWCPWIVEGILSWVEQCGWKKVHMFELEFENQKTNFEIQNLVCFMMTKF